MTTVRDPRITMQSRLFGYVALAEALTVDVAERATKYGYVSPHQLSM